MDPQWVQYLLVILLNRITGSLKWLKSQNFITIMLNITPLSVNLHSPGKSMFVTLTITSDNSFPKSLPKSSTNSLPWNGRSTKNCTHFLNGMNYRYNLSG